MSNPAKPNKIPAADWWRGSVTYQIYVRSFAAGSAQPQSSVGSLAGITEKLDYVASLGVDAIWLTPFFRSPMRDYGYDVADYTAIDRMFGDQADFVELLAAAHARGLKVLIDQVFNHSSDQHPWFVQSRQSRDNARSDWYVWSDPKPDGSPPNNWLAIFGGSAWQWCPIRCQYYLHQFLASQPDLNVNNKEVQDALLDSMRFWLELGVDGFRLDTVNFYCQDEQLRDNPPWPPGQRPTHVAAVNPYSMQEQKYNLDQPQNLAFLARMRALLDSHPNTTCVGEIGSFYELDVLSAYTQGSKHLHSAYSFAFLTREVTPQLVAQVCAQLEAKLGDGWPTWSFSNHDVTRVVSRATGLEPRSRATYAQMMLVLLGCLRGSLCLYQGEELGLNEAELSFEQLQDPFGIEFWPSFKGRDGCRTPMPWDSQQQHCGFSAATPWLPIPPEHQGLAVDRQERDPESSLNAARRWLHWRRQQPTLLVGDLKVEQADDNLLVIRREHPEQSLLAAFNFSDRPQQLACAQPPLYADATSDSALLAPYGYRISAA